ncbi:MAG: FAD-dependent oxidoreductase, partial [Candidatus Margulisiibacteriota bacterium]
RLANVRDFRLQEWASGGIFSDVYPDKGIILGLVGTADNRLRHPEWENHVYCAPCEYGCPVSIPSQERYNLLREGKIKEALGLVYDYNPFPRTVCGEVCPNPCMTNCSRKNVDQAIDLKGLGVASELSLVTPSTTRKEKIAIIGAGVGGLTAGWHLRQLGYDVTLYDQEASIGGKLVNAVSRERLSPGALEKDLTPFQSIGITYHLSTPVTDTLYQKLKKDFSAVILATGAYQPKLPPWPGKEKLMISLDFLAKINSGKKVSIGKRVVVIGAGNTGMDVVFGAYASGAKSVVVLDVQKPNAFEKEIAHAERLGATLRWPCFTQEITDKGVLLNTGELIEADTVISAIGEVPILDYISDFKETDRGYLKVDPSYHLVDNVYAIGDITRLGLLADAIGHGREIAYILDGLFSNKPYAPRIKKVIDQNQLSLAYFDSMSAESIEGAAKDVDRCISCGSCRDCRLCKDSCPEKAINRVQNEDNSFEYVCDSQKCIGCGICVAVCPCGIWKMYANPPTFPM